MNGAGDSGPEQGSVTTQFRHHADGLVRNGRSPLYAALIYAAAEDIDAGGVVASLMDGIPAPPGSVPQLRLMAALHELVLSGRVPELARFYPSARGDQPPGRAWPVAREALQDNFDWIRARLGRTVQTNEPGRSAVLYGALLWLTDRHRLPIRLLEIGASAGLNLRVDRWRYVVAGAELGNRDSAVEFVEPWRPPPPIDVARAASELEIRARAGCDSAPLSPAREADRTRLESYIWPDEIARIKRLRAALDEASREPVPVARASAAQWLPDALAARRADELTVVWHSVMRQYVGAEAWVATKAAIARAHQSDPGAPIVRLSMEPHLDHTISFRVAAHYPGDARIALGRCGDHGPPVSWNPEPMPAPG